MPLFGIMSTLLQILDVLKPLLGFSDRGNRRSTDFVIVLSSQSSTPL